MDTNEHEVDYDKYDSEIEKVLERKYPGAVVHKISETIQGPMAGSMVSHDSTWTGTWKGEAIRLVFTAKKREEDLPPKRAQRRM